MTQQDFKELQKLVDEFFGFDTENEKDQCNCKKQETKKDMHMQTFQQQKYTVTNSDKNKIIKVLLPGIKKESVDLSYDGKHIVLKLKSMVDCNTFVNNDMCLSFNVDETCDIENIETTLELGILTIVIPKKEITSSIRVIEIK